MGIETGDHIMVHCRKVRVMPRLVDSSSSDGDVKMTRPSGFFMSNEKSLHVQSSSCTDEKQIYCLPSESDSSSYEISDLEEVD